MPSLGEERIKASSSALGGFHGKSEHVLRSSSIEDPGFRSFGQERGPYIYVPSPFNDSVDVFWYLVHNRRLRKFVGDAVLEICLFEAICRIFASWLVSRERADCGGSQCC